MAEKPSYQELEKRLEQAEKQCEQLVQSLSEILCRADPEGRITYVSPNVERLTGYRPEEILGRGYFSFVDPDWADAARENFRKVLEGSELVVETPYKTRNGGVLWLMNSARPIYENGCIAGVQGVLMPVTRRRQAEMALRESEEKYRLIFENAPFGVLHFEKNGRITDCNDIFVRIIGSSRQALIGLNMLALKDKRAVAAVREALQGRQGFYEDIYRSTTAEKATPVRAMFTPLVDPCGVIKGGVAMVEDITERKEAQKALQESEARYRFLVEASSDIIWTFDLASMSWTYCSRSVEQILGIPQEKAIGATLDDVFFYETKKQVLTNFSKVMTGEAGTDRILMEGLHRHQDGSGVWMEISAVLHRDSSNQPLSFTGVSRDITWRKQAEKQKKRLEERLSEARKMEALGRMAGAVAHHFNNRLSVVIGNLEMAMDPQFPSDTVRGYIRKARDAGRQASHVSGQMLTYLGKTGGEKNAVDLSELCRGQVPDLRKDMPAAARLESRLADPGPVVRGNPAELAQALASLVVNGWEALEGQEGVVYVRTGVVVSSRIGQFRIYPGDWKPEGEAFACLEIGDTGSGIHPDMLDKIFDPFFSTKFVGRGLGLSLVLGIARAQNGAVGVRSGAGERGAVFCLFLPLEMDPAVTNSGRDFRSA